MADGSGNIKSERLNPHDVRLALLARGYEPLLLLAKAPKLWAWEAGSITPERLAKWEARHPEYVGTGVRCGALAAVDIDLDDPKHATIIYNVVQSVLGSNIMHRIGRKPGGVLVYRNIGQPRRIINIKCDGPKAKKGERRKQCTLVQFLGRGQQVGVYSGDYYSWPHADDGGEPLQTPFADVPPVTTEDLEKCAVAVADKLTELGYPNVRNSAASRPPRKPAKGEGAPVTLEQLDEMLRHIDPGEVRTDWIKMGGALLNAHVVLVPSGEENPEFDAEEIFVAWSRGEFWDGGEPENWTSDEDARYNFSTLTADKQDGSKFGSLVEFARSGEYEGESNCLPQLASATSDPTAGLDAESQILVGAAIDELNERYAMITGALNHGKIVDLQDPTQPVLLKPADFDAVYANQKPALCSAKGEPSKRQPTKAQLWRASPKRRDINRIIFEPPGSPAIMSPKDHNVWQGFAVEPKPGDAHEPFLDHLLRIICHCDLDLYWWLCEWMADLVQAPGRRKFGAAVAVRGAPGTGKTVIGDYLLAIFGAHGMRVSRKEHLAGRFNAHLERLAFLHIEEIALTDDRDASSTIKDLITSHTVTVEPKFAMPYTISNHVHLLLTANPEWIIAADADERRWAVFDALPDRRSDRTYFKPIFEALEGDGPANLLYYLLHEVACDVRDPPMSKAKATQTSLSLPPIDRWWRDVLMGDRSLPVSVGAKDGIFGADTPKADTPKKVIFDDHVTWCHENKEKLADVGQFWRRMLKLVGPSMLEREPRQQDGTRPRVVSFPPREECQEAFAKALGGKWADFT